MRQRAGRLTAKGTSRRVVIVPGEEGSVFEQIICVVRADPASRQGVTAESILQEAEMLLMPEDSEETEEPPRIFSGAVVVLLVIAIVLSVVILLYLHLHGWS